MYARLTLNVVIISLYRMVVQNHINGSLLLLFHSFITINITAYCYKLTAFEMINYVIIITIIYVSIP